MTDLPFPFLAPGPLVDGDLELVLAETQPAAESIWREPAYLFVITHRPTGEPVGRASLRVGHRDWTVRYNGHVGYAVADPFCGRRYAERACRLLLPLARRHGLAELWLMCGSDNPVSRRTIERLGASFVEEVDVPPDFPLPAGAVRRKRRYRLDLLADMLPDPPGARPPS